MTRRLLGVWQLSYDGQNLGSGYPVQVEITPDGSDYSYTIKVFALGANPIRPRRCTKPRAARLAATS